MDFCLILRHVVVGQQGSATSVTPCLYTPCASSGLISAQTAVRTAIFYTKTCVTTTFAEKYIYLQHNVELRDLNGIKSIIRLLLTVYNSCNNNKKYIKYLEIVRIKLSVTFKPTGVM